MTRITKCPELELQLAINEFVSSTDLPNLLNENINVRDALEDLIINILEIYSALITPSKLKHQHIAILVSEYNEYMKLLKTVCGPDNAEYKNICIFLFFRLTQLEKILLKNECYEALINLNKFNAVDDTISPKK